MPPTLQELGLDTLSREDKAAVAEALWASVEAETESEPISDELKAELERRIAAIDADPSILIPLEDALAAVRARWGR